MVEWSSQPQTLVGSHIPHNRASQPRLHPGSFTHAVRRNAVVEPDSSIAPVLPLPSIEIYPLPECLHRGPYLRVVIIHW